jgi:hypothetical protein
MRRGGCSAASSPRIAARREGEGQEDRPGTGRFAQANRYLAAARIRRREVLGGLIHEYERVA